MIHLPSAPKSALLTHRNELIIQKMKMDKFFTRFLDAHQLTEENTCTPEWHTYKTMLNDYEKLNASIKSTDYYIKKHG
jgi:hypothetical protein